MKAFWALAIISVFCSFSNSYAQTNEEMFLGESQTSVQAQQEPNKKFYGNVILGLEGYPEVSNVDKGYNVLASFGYYLKQNWMLEAGLGMAKSQLTQKNTLFTNYRDTFNVDQYQLVTAAKYALTQFAGTNFKPSLGVALSYTYRSYNLLNGVTTNSGHTGDSTSLDAGVGAGLDYAFSNKFEAGLDLKYMLNMGHKINSNYNNPTYGYDGKALEGFQYYVAGVSARMNF